MQLTINGEQQTVPDGLSVQGLVVHLGLGPERVAVEVNLEVVRRAEHATRALKDGDAVEIVSFVGGG